MRHSALALWVIGVGFYFGGAVSMVFGLPDRFVAVAIAGCIASFATLMAGLLWRQRVKRKPEVFLAPGKWPCQDFAVCTEAERRADLLAMAEGRITLEEWLERRRAQPSPPRVKSDGQWKEDLRIGIFKEIMRNPAYESEQPACQKCLGIHETETCHVKMSTFTEFTKHFAEMMMLPEPATKGVGEYTTIEELTAPPPHTGVKYVTGTNEIPPFKPGDCVRVIYPLSYMYRRLAKLIEGEGRVWMAEFGGSKFTIREGDFILALPQKGEVWNCQTCVSCDARWKSKWDHNKPFNVNHNWTEDPMIRCRINCGCVYRIGEQS